MRWVYLDNDSYPELRGVRRGWARSAIWWRAIGRAFRHADFWRYALLQVAIVLLALGVGIAGALLFEPVGNWVPVFALPAFGYLQVSLGGDMMRRHLRAVSTIARYACPSCGQSLVGHLDAPGSSVRCPECAATVDRALFEPPYVVPREFRKFPPWRARAVESEAGGAHSTTR